jgi:hypothetical protein
VPKSSPVGLLAPTTKKPALTVWLLTIAVIASTSVTVMNPTIAFLISFSLFFIY